MKEVERKKKKNKIKELEEIKNKRMMRNELDQERIYNENNEYTKT